MSKALGVLLGLIGGEAVRLRPRWGPLHAPGDRPPMALETHEALIAPDNLSALHSIAQQFSIGYIGLASRFWVRAMNRYAIEGEDRLFRAIFRPAEERCRRPLLTVANHTSVADDPMLMSAMVPLHCLWRLTWMRWGVCAQDICFSNAAKAAFCLTGKTLPVKRGGGVHQLPLKTVITKLNRGEWVHYFPEGRIWQDVVRDPQGRFCLPSGRAAPPFRQLGPLKWGVGRLILESDQPPLVLPYFHSGMDQIFPVTSQNKRANVMPKFGKHVRVTVGQPLEFDDLIAEYRKARDKHGGNLPWATREEYYRRATARVEVALTNLSLEHSQRWQLPR